MRLAEKMAIQISEELKLLQTMRVPTARVLSKSKGIAYTTALETLKILKDQKIIRPDRFILTEKASSKQKEFNKKEPIQYVYKQVKAQIQEQKLKIGDALGKLSDYTQLFKVSKTSIVKAFELLQAKKLIYKKGRKWIVGVEPPKQSKSKWNIPNTILILCQDRNSWIRLF